ncbi:MAG: rhomboid family intramembrane serine protease, partial [Clostridiales bacterium]|nr:rhomboid family intramembrane serine protease [Clostridiales bacterium]
MKKISSAINIFCYKHPKFGISRLMMYIVGGTALVFVIDMMDTTGTFLPMLMFLPDQVFKGEIWRIVTWVFIPANSNILWLAISLYFYYWIGSTLEQSWGAGKLTIYYLSGILLNVVFSLVAYRIGGYYAYVVLSPTYLNLSFFFAFASLYPDTRVMLMFFIPV